MNTTTDSPVRMLPRIAVLLVMILVWQPFAGAVEPIRVGMTVSLSGPYEIPGANTLEGVEMWVHDIDQRGALLGHPIEIVYYDDESDPETSARLYEKLISEDKVDLLLGPYGSDITLAASRVAERHNFPMVATAAASGDIWARGYHNIFGVDAEANHYMDLLIGSAADAGLKTIALVYQENDFPEDVADGVRVEAENRGMQIVYERHYPDTTTDFSALVSGMKAAAPELVIGGTYLDDSIALVREAKRQQFSPKAFAFTVGPALAEFVDILGPDANGIMGVVAWMRSAAMPMAMDFAFRYKEKFGRNPSVSAALGYGGAQVLEAAVRLAQTLQHDKVREQLLNMKFQSLLGHYRVDKTGLQIAKSTYVMQVQNGWRLLVLPRELQESKVKYPFKPWSER